MAGHEDGVGQADHVLPALGDQAQHLAAQLTGTLRRISLRCGDVAVEVEWQPATGEVAVTPSGLAAAGTSVGAPLPDGEDVVPVTAPMVGTFYQAPEPGAEPFVRVGDDVAVGQTVGIVEAMKLMNPICAEIAGRVVAVAVDDGEPVEFGQVLLTLETAQ